jgi:hypothetical protein
VDVGDVSIGELVGNVTKDLSTLMRQELALAQAEVKAEVSKTGKAAGALGAAGSAGYVAVPASSLLPATRREQELADQAKQVAQEKVQPVVSQVASEVGDNLREPAQQAVESVKSTAQDAARPWPTKVARRPRTSRAEPQAAAGTARTTDRPTQLRPGPAPHGDPTATTPISGQISHARDDRGRARTDRQRLAQQLVQAARAEGVELVGPGGLLTGLTKDGARDRPESRDERAPGRQPT